MARYEILIKPSAVKEIEAIPRKKDRRRIVDRIMGLGDDPRPVGCEKLSSQDRYRVRQGNYRIVYALEDSTMVVRIVKVGHREDVYR
ncbi:type II toxin-antitoxin system RelE/ParE family toxin [Acidobacteria bacterium AH-259-D05]|nr:type II toxin-antitoxin system RelE/ParE family toxin [Acidobacteria bacterium AH-259-D05]